MSIRILGISAYFHDSAAALVVDGDVVAAAQEERFTRVKGDASFPHQAIGWCLEYAGLDIREIDYIVFYEHPVLKFERLFSTYLLTAPQSVQSFLHAMPDWITHKLWLEREIANELGVRCRIWFVGHHVSHAASAFYPSPYEEAAILTVDGVGEWSTATWGVGRGAEIQLMEELKFPNSLGLLYSAFTYYCGFKINSGEYKLMGLAPYGRPVYADRIRERLVKILPTGAVLLNQKYFGYATGLRSTNRLFHELFAGPPRNPESQITQREMDLAASIQEVLSESLGLMATHIREQTGQRNLVLAGGVALNCVATGRLSSTGQFESLWTQPAAGDAGGALGAALAFWHARLKKPRTVRRPDAMHGAFLGPEIRPNDTQDDAMLRQLGAKWETLDEVELQERIATEVAEGKILAIARGRLEFGPRALGARSILGDARSEQLQAHMNLKIKFRESFRPFAPMVLACKAEQYFTVRQESPYMLLVSHIVPERRRTPPESNGLFGIELLKVPRSDIPAVTHVDFSARVQTIDRDRNPFMHGVLTRFYERTGCAVMVNTSFNVRGEPIVNSVEDAYRCFMATEIDCLVVGNRFLDRKAQPNPPLNDDERTQWLQRFELD